MILKIVYDKSIGSIVLTNDENLSCVVNESEKTDNDLALSFEVAIDVSSYQELFNEDFIDGDNNE